jgi:hypothetical protein
MEQLQWLRRGTQASTKRGEKIQRFTFVGKRAYHESQSTNLNKHTIVALFQSQPLRAQDLSRGYR